MRRNRVLTLVVAAVTCVAPLLLASPADAHSRVRNGQIAFRRLDVATGGSALWIANPDGSHQRQLTGRPGLFSDWSPDGRRLAFDYFTDEGDEHIATIRARGGPVRPLTRARGIQEVPKWSSDGRWLTFDAAPVRPDDPTFSTAIWTMRADGSRARRITFDGFDVEPVFSPDGARIAFARLSFEPDRAALYVVNRDGSGLRELVSSRAGLEHPDWSPDGRLITFNVAPEAGDAPDSGSVVAFDVQTSQLAVLAAAGRFRYFKPVWSPDGRRLLVGCNDGQVDNLCVLDRTGSGARVVVAGSAAEPVNFPSWGTHPRAQPR